jgi:hypothetical protein
MADWNEARPARATLPEITLSDLTIDESWDDLTRISRCCTSVVPVQRLVYVKLMGSTAPLVGCVLPA